MGLILLTVFIVKMIKRELDVAVYWALILGILFTGFSLILISGIIVSDPEKKRTIFMADVKEYAKTLDSIDCKLVSYTKSLDRSTVDLTLEDSKGNTILLKDTKLNVSVLDNVSVFNVTYAEGLEEFGVEPFYEIVSYTVDK